MNIKNDNIPLADADITITIPDARLVTVFTNLIALEGQEIELCATNFSASKKLVLPMKGSDTNRQYTRKCTRIIMRNLTRLGRQKVIDDEYETDISAVVKGTEAIPTDVFT
jgi:hypothetical protein